MKLKNSLFLFLAAVIWGFAFVAQSVGMDYVQPFTFNCARSIIGGIVLIPVVLILRRGKTEERRNAEPVRGSILGGIACGIVLCIASNLQQFGIQFTTVGKAGFITAMYVVLVPVFSIFLHKKAGLKVWLAVVIAVVGLYLLCMTGGFSLSRGDTMVFLCAIAFTFHILVIDHFSPKTDCVLMSCVQFLVSGILSGIGMLITEQPQLSLICAAWLPILYAGVMSSGVAYTLQIVGQKDMNPTVASLLLSLESVFSVIGGWMILGQTLSVRELVGCVLMFAAIVLAQLPSKKESKAAS